MAIIVFCIDQAGAKVFQRSGPSQVRWDSIELFHPKMRTAQKNGTHLSDEYARYLSSEIELAGSQDTTSSIILCAEPPILLQLSRLLTETARTRLLGTIASNLKFAAEERLSTAISELIEEKELQAS